MANPLDIRSLITSDNNLELETKLVDILEPLLATSNPSTASVEAAASSIDQLYPGSKDAEDFFWTLWTLVFRVAKNIPVDDARLQTLASTITNLKAKSRESVEIWGQSWKLWDELPLIGAVMREEWNFTPEFDGSDKDATTINQWISINSFAARLVGSSTHGHTNFALWELRDGLEEPLVSTPAAKETCLTTASEWIIHAGKVLHHEGKREVPLDPDEARALASGKLYEGGKAGFNEERWSFWKKRLEELSADVREDIKARVEKALGVIKNLEA